MKSLAFYLVDVFAEEKYAGNQLAVIRNGNALSSAQMQRVANEMHFSETTFILSDEKRNDGYDVRIFTPAREMPFAGHPTLGTAYVIRHNILDGNVNEVTLNLKLAQITVTFEGAKKSEVSWMEQIPPTFGNIFDHAKTAKMLNLDVKDIDSKYPIQEVSTGVPFIIVPLRTLNAVKRARIDKAALVEFTKETQSGVLIFCTQTYKKENNLNVRVFVDLFGIPEDPATGSGNGCLAGYLSRHHYFGSDLVNARVEQGYEIGRPSLLYLKARENGNKIKINVGGKVVMVAKGELV